MSHNALAEIMGMKQYRRPTPAERLVLDAQIITGKRSALDVRADAREDNGMVYCGRPRNPKPRKVSTGHAGDNGALSKFDAQYTWRG